ncbi:GNAT family N-acetyltransferase [Symbiobacterium terraclitae]|uniref:GNAT family N-acetyltransferase n=1 Tax=Symbiobacterium terraclitae TaxID=557451 RepID=UPI0035B52B9C
MLQLITERLRLRPLDAEDEGGVQALAADERVAAHSLSMPDPLPDGGAVAWIAEQQQGWEAGTSYGFAIYTAEPRAFVGVVTLKVSQRAGRAELGYAIMPDAWGRGYATEAAREVLRFAFEGLHLRRVTAACLAGNRASIRVLEKLGFRLEARLEPEEPGSGSGLSMLFYGLMLEEYLGRRGEAAHTDGQPQ